MADRVKEVSAFNGTSWGAAVPLGANDSNIDITSSTTQPDGSAVSGVTGDSATALDTSAVAVAEGDTGASAWTKFNRFRKRVASNFANYIQGSIATSYNATGSDSAVYSTNVLNNYMANVIGYSGTTAPEAGSVADQLSSLNDKIDFPIWSPGSERYPALGSLEDLRTFCLSLKIGGHAFHNLTLTCAASLYDRITVTYPSTIFVRRTSTDHVYYIVFTRQGVSTGNFSLVDLSVTPRTLARNHVTYYDLDDQSSILTMASGWRLDVLQYAKTDTTAMIRWKVTYTASTTLSGSQTCATLKTGYRPRINAPALVWKSGGNYMSLITGSGDMTINGSIAKNSDYTCLSTFLLHD